MNVSSGTTDAPRATHAIGMLMRSWRTLVELCSLAALLACAEAPTAPMAPENTDGSQVEATTTVELRPEFLRGTDGEDADRDRGILEFEPR